MLGNSTYHDSGAISLGWIGRIILPSDESHNSQRTHRHNRTSVGQPHPMEPHLGRIEVRASPRSLSARKTHGHEHHQRNAPCLYLPNRQDTSRIGNCGNPQQTRNRLDTAPAVAYPAKEGNRAGGAEISTALRRGKSKRGSKAGCGIPLIFEGAGVDVSVPVSVPVGFLPSSRILTQRWRAG